MTNSISVIKKLLSVSLCAAIVCATAVLAQQTDFAGGNTGSITVNAAAKETPASSFMYTENHDGTISILEFIGNETDVVVPSHINGKSVTSVKSSFLLEADKVKTIHLPSTIEDLSFDSTVRMKYSSLQGFSVDPDNQYFCAENGVLYTKDKKMLILCPPSKKGTFIVPDGVEKVYDCAFVSCPDITSIHIPASVWYFFLPEYGMTGCSSLKEIVVDKDNAYYCSDNGVLLNKNKTTLLQYPCAKKGSYKIPDSVKNIESYSFSCAEGLTEITLPVSLEKICTMAFNKCSSLSSVRLPSKVNEIERNVFYECAKLENIEVDTANKSFCSVNGVLFSKDKTLLIRFPQAKKGKYTIPEGTLTVGDFSFASCTGITDVKFPSTLNNIGGFAFYNDTGLKKAVMSENITNLENMAFGACSELEEIVISKKLRNVRGSSLVFCEKLKKIVAPEDCENYISVDGVLFDKEKTKLIKFPEAKGGSYTIPETVTTLDDNSFALCKKLEALHIPKSLVETGDMVFLGATSPAKITVDKDNTHFEVRNSALIEKDKKQLVWMFDKTCAAYTVPDGIEAIKPAAFFGLKKLRSLVLPKGLKTVNYLGVCNSPELSNVIVNDSETVFNVYAIGWNLPLNADYYNSFEVLPVPNLHLIFAAEKDSNAFSYAESAGFRCLIPDSFVTASGIKLDKTSASIEKKGSITLKTTLSPSGVTDKYITWESSDKSIAKVSGGKVTGVKPGTATITATASSGKKASCKVTVKISATKLKLNKTKATLKKGRILMLKATASPSDTTDKVKWTTSNKKVATVDSKGKVKAVGKGTATITAKAGSKKATCKITVTVPSTKVKLSKTKATLKVGKSLTLKATMTPKNSTDKLTWTTSNKKVATVKNGKVTAKKAGTVTITVKTSSGKKATCKITVKKK